MLRTVEAVVGGWRCYGRRSATPDILYGVTVSLADVLAHSLARCLPLFHAADCCLECVRSWSQRSSLVLRSVNGLQILGIQVSYTGL